MTLFPNTILISVNTEQKQSVTVGGMLFQIVPNRHTYEQNGRETNPVVAEVVQAGEGVPLQPGEYVVLHHNMAFDELWKMEAGSVIPFDRWVMAKVSADGNLIAMPGNIICERVPKPETAGEYALPETAQEFYKDRVKTDDGIILGIRKWSDYEVCWNWNGEVRRKVVLWEGDVECTIREREVWQEIMRQRIIKVGDENMELWKKIMGDDWGSDMISKYGNHAEPTELENGSEARDDNDRWNEQQSDLELLNQE
jgi:hypothetical protein